MLCLVVTLKEFNKWRRELCVREIAEAQALAVAYEERAKKVAAEYQAFWAREMTLPVLTVPPENISGIAQCAPGLPAPVPSPTGLGQGAEGPGTTSPWRRIPQRVTAIIRGAFRGS